MFGIGFWEWILISAVLIICIPPRKIPHVLRNLGKLYSELTDLTRRVTREIDRAAADDSEPDSPENKQ